MEKYEKFLKALERLYRILLAIGLALALLCYVKQVPATGVWWVALAILLAAQAIAVPMRGWHIILMSQKMVAICWTVDGFQRYRIGPYTIVSLRLSRPDESGTTITCRVRLSPGEREPDWSSGQLCFRRIPTKPCRAGLTGWKAAIEIA